MTRAEAMTRLTLAYGHQPAVANFNIVAVNHVLDSLIQAEREACAQIAKKWIHAYPHPSAAIEEEIRARGQDVQKQDSA